MIKEYLDRIVEKGNIEDMERLGFMLQDLMREVDKETCMRYKAELYEMAYGKVLTEEKAKNIVCNMKPRGEHWTIEQTNQVKEQYGLVDISDIDFYVVMNMAYNDYYDLFNENVDYYVKFSKDFILDEDAQEGKVYLYFTEVV